MKPVILAISGAKNVGKTTLITNLIPYLKKHSLTVYVIKHDGHDFIPDVPNTDTFYMQQAGADGTAIFSDSTVMIVKKRTDKIKDFETRIFQAFPNADMILLEGFKNTSYPKIEVLRKEINLKPLSAKSSLIALVSDTLSLHKEYCVPLFTWNDTTNICKFVLSFYRSKVNQ